MINPTKSAILFCGYLPPISYFSALHQSEKNRIDVHENLVKQTYRNRCHIVGPNGLLKLTIPIHRKSMGAPIKDAEIMYAENWLKIHWKSFEMAYRNSPYFEYYEDDFHPFFHQTAPRFLADFNLALLDFLITNLGISTEIIKTTEYHKEIEGTVDYRTSLNSKTDNTLSTKPYTQVFQEKVGFHPNLSIIDLLFNEGPNAISFLQP